MMERNSDQEPTMDASAVDAGEELRVEHRPTHHVGRAIAEARKAKGLSQADLAQTLNLDLRVVELIEAGMFDAAPEPIYVRAYLKSWAGLLGLDADDLIRNYELSLDEPPEEGATRSRSGKKKLEVMSGSTAPRRGGGGKFWSWLIWLVLLAIVGLLVAQFLPERLQGWLGKSPVVSPSNQTIVPLERQPQSSPSAKPSAGLPPPAMSQGSTGESGESPLPIKPLAALPDASKPSGAVASTESTGNSANPATNTAAEGASNLPAPSAEQQAGSAAGTVVPSALPSDNLVIKAVGADCWVEVKNAAGTRLMYDVLKAGSERRFGGNGPFSVVLGNPKAVEVLWKGKPVQMGAGNQTTGVVRVKVGGS